jgi:hypothetical protein
MPGFDGTGPRGMGPMTGGGRGFCSPWGMGAAYGRGRGMPYPMAAPYPMPYAYPYRGTPYPPAPPATASGAPPYPPQMNQAQELEFLKEQAQNVRDQLVQISDRIKELEA